MKPYRILALFSLVVLPGILVVLATLQGRKMVEAARHPTGIASLRVPKGFTVEQVAGPNLTNYAMLGTLDERGRLFVCESSGNNLTNSKMSGAPEFRVRMLEDTNDDGVFDRSTIFADKLTLPAGAVWYRGSLYVAAPPDLVRLEDTNGDGIADRREVLVTGWNLSSNAASLHGPFFGPDGWLYLTDGRHGFKITSKDGKKFEGLASRIWRVRPDGSGLEVFAGGGFDNPVELIFTPAGETIGTMTYFVDPRNGERDALLHFVEGGVYPKPHPSASEFKRTGDWMPVMTKFARIAPSGLMQYRGAAFGGEYRGNLFTAQFNPHRVQRHVVHREGASFRTEDQDFLTSLDPDFHPTDVMEDADGSILVVDTGAWFIHGCPISRISKPEIKGAIYRIRKTGAPKVADPRGEKVKLDDARNLADARPVVRDRVLETLVERGAASIPALKSVREHETAADVRCAAVWGLFRIGTPVALAAVRDALADKDFQVRTAAARASGMAKDHAAVDRLSQMAQKDEPPVRRQAAASLGQIGDARAVPALIAAAAGVEDRFIEHSIIYSLMELGNTAALTKALGHRDAHVRKTALIALDQMDGAPLPRQQLAPFLSAADQQLRSAALWVVSHHPDWSGEVLKFLDARLRAPQLARAETTPVREALQAFCSDSDTQNMVARILDDGSTGVDRRLFLLDTMDGCRLKEFPQSWIAPLGKQLAAGDPKVRARTVALIRSRRVDALDGELEKIMQPDDLRVAALGVLVTRHPKLTDANLQFLLARLDAKGDATLRLSTAQALGRTDLTREQLQLVARQYVPKADALIMPDVLGAFRRNKDEEVGSALITAMLNSKVAVGDQGGRRLQEVLQNYSAKVQASAKPLFARFQEEQKARIERLKKLEPLLTANGDVGRGRRVFFGDKVSCSSCHTIGPEGGHVGPDLTAVGAIRSGHDLLEAIVFPSSSFVPGYEIYNVTTKDEMLAGVVKDRTQDGILLVTGPNAELRIPKANIVSMRPSNVSLMPEGLDDGLTKPELADLLAFLQAQKARSAP